MKSDHLGKAKTSLKIDALLRDEAKSIAGNRLLTLGNLIEEALTEYLKQTPKPSD